ncbi:DUF5719 family protein [Georgenia alba]|uniref:DUF5719 family protein n=1 Tax=Georgenia alba TaxID=2233858 RepID=A0ABW2Q6D7_9MICO
MTRDERDEVPEQQPEPNDPAGSPTPEPDEGSRTAADPGDAAEDTRDEAEETRGAAEETDRAPGDTDDGAPEPAVAPADPDEAPTDGPTAESPTADRPSGRVGVMAVLRGFGLAVTAVVVLAAAGGIVIAAENDPPPEPEQVSASPVDVPAGPLTQVCAGPAELTTGEGMGVDPALDPADVEPHGLTRILTLPRADGRAPEGTYVPIGGEAEDLAPAGQVGRLGITDPDRGGILTAEPVGDVAALAAGATVTRTNAGDLRGLAAAACQTPASTTWLVGGGTDLGQSSQLVLTNTGQTPATVRATMWTSLGVADAPRLSEIAIAPGEQVEVLLEGVAAGDPSLALRVDAAGGQVAARLQDLQLDGLVSAGLDHVTTAAPPGLRRVVPGVVLGESDIDDAVASQLRLVNPGEEEATARVRLLGADGPVDVPGAEEVVLDPGTTLDLTLAGIPAGAYSVEITSDRPVTGGVVLTRIGQAGEIDPDVPPVERAWTAAAEPAAAGILQTPTSEGVVDGATLVLSNPGEDDVEVSLTPVTEQGETGEPETVTVPAGSTLTRDAAALNDGGPAVVVRSDGGGVVASTLLTADGADGELLSVLPMTPDAHESRSVRVDVG